MISTGSLGINDSQLRWLLSLPKNNSNSFEELLRRPYYQRLLQWGFDRSTPAYEGITWIKELLPKHPQRAIDVLDAFLLSHFDVLPDGRIFGISDAMTLIRAKFIGLPGTKLEMLQFLFDLDDRQFEHIIERLYDKMGYKTTLTPPKSDGGRDVIATKDEPAYKERIAIECKNYRKPVGVEYVRRLQGVVSFERFNKGVLVTPSRFTKGANGLAQEDNRIELLSGDKLILLLNQAYGTTWSMRVDSLISKSRRLSNVS